MRKILLAGAMMLGLAFGANAQKGSVLVYGNTTFGTENHKAGTNFSLNPGVGYQFNEKWTVGVDLGIGTEKGAYPSYQAGAFLRYTQPINGTFAIYEQLGVGYLHQGEANGFNPYGVLSVMGNNLTEQGGSNGFYGVVSLPTVFINVKNGFGVNLGFGNIGFSTMKNKGGESNSKFSFNFGNAVSVGISKNFGGKK